MSTTYNKFREDMLCALYQEQMHNGVDDYISFRELAADYDIEWRKGWLLDLQKSLIQEGFLRGPSNSQNDEMAIGNLIGSGLRYIENKYGTLKGVPTMIAKRGERLVTAQDGPFDAEIFDPEIFDTGKEPAQEGSIDSSHWTGLPRTGSLSADAAAKVVAAVEAAQKKLDDLQLANTEKAQMHAYLVAIRVLAESPDPPADVIWTLISRAADITQLAMVVAALVGLFS